VPLIGGGGSPNVSGGSNPAGTGGSINYVGNHAYVSSGLVNSGTTTETTMVQFTTASESYIVGYFHFIYSDDTDQDMIYRLYFNDQIVWQYVAQSAAQDVQGRNDVYILMPASTRVKGTVESDGAARNSSAFFTGRVYA
jgi:hypothetical protein